MKIDSKVLNGIPGIEYFFGTLRDPFGQGDPVAPADWNTQAPAWKQVHGVAIAEVNSPAQNLGEADGIYSRTRGLWAAAVHADCVPILLARKDGSEVAALHAGWRGVFHEIVAQWSVVHLRPNGSDWVAVLGPSIQACCFEVGVDLRDDFVNKFSALIPAWEINPQAGRTLNLQRILEAQLRSIGIERIERIPLCTVCAKEPLNNKDSPLFSSYRRDKKTSRQLSGLRRQ